MWYEAALNNDNNGSDIFSKVLRTTLLPTGFFDLRLTKFKKYSLEGWAELLETKDADMPTNW